MKGRSVTKRPNTVTESCNRTVTLDRDKRDMPTVARARTPLRGYELSVTLVEKRDTEKRDTVTRRDVTRDSDSLPPCGLRPSRSRPGPSRRSPGPTWMHLAARRILDDHAAGKPVRPDQVVAARKLLGET